MELIRGSALFRHLLDQYSKKPIGWNFTIAPSEKDRFFDALVSGPDESWRLKIDSIFKPSPLVIGAKTDAPQGPASSPSAPYGYRKIDAEFLFKLIREIAPEDSQASKTKNLDQLLGSLEPVKPVENGSYIEGPFVFSRNPVLTPHSTSQYQLDEKLSQEIKKLMRDKYPGYG
jgi:hypothetical protein